MIFDNKKILLILFISLTGCGFNPVSRDIEFHADKGEADLSSLRFRENKVLLNGSWEFRENHFIEPGETFNKKEYLSVPGFWNDQAINGRKLNPYGHASYRLIVRGLDEGLYGIRMVDLESAYALYANGVKIGSNGIPATTKEKTIPEWRPETYIINVKRDENLELILHVSNFHHRLGGIWKPVEIGNADFMLNSRNRALTLEVFFVGAIFIASLYHLQLFLLRRKEFPFLYFSIGWFLLALRTLCTGERQIVSMTGIDWNTLVRLDYLTSIFSYLMFHLFLYTSNPARYSRKILKTILGISISFSAFVMATEPAIFTWILVYQQAFLLIFGFYWLYSSFRSYRDRIPGFGAIFYGGIIMVLTGMNDIFYISLKLNSGFMLHYGSFAFLITQSYYLSLRYDGEFKKSEMLSRNIERLLNITRNISGKRTIADAIASALNELVRDNAVLQNTPLFFCIKDGETSLKTFKYVKRDGTVEITDSFEIDRVEIFKGTQSWFWKSGSYYFPVVHSGQTDVMVVAHARENTFSDDIINYISGVLYSLGPVIDNIRSQEKSKLAAIGQMAAEIVHDIRNHLQVIFLSVEKKTEGLAMSDEVKKTFDSVKEEAKSLSHMSQDILDYAKEIIILQKENTELNSYLKNLIDEIKDFAQNHSVFVELHASEKCYASIDRERFRRALLNLAKNGVEEMSGKGGRLDISCDNEEDEAFIIIKDTGRGIDPDKLKSIFTPFASGNKPGGTGLGLVVVKKIIDAHGGDISAISDENGSRFTIKLPVRSVRHMQS